MGETNTSEETMQNSLNDQPIQVQADLTGEVTDRTEASEETKTNEGSMLDKLKSRAMEVHASVTEKITDASEASKEKLQEVQANIAEKINDASEVGMEKLQELMAEVDEISPILRELGYTLESLQVSVGLIPNVSIDIGGMTKTMPEETYQKVLEEHKDRKILISVVKTLQTVSALQQKVHFMGMRSDMVTITLGLPPKVILKFNKTE